MNSIEELKNLAQSYSLEFIDCGNGHIKLKAHGVCVDYWPLSKKGTARLNGVNYPHCSNWDAVQICRKNGLPGLRPAKKVLAKGKPQGDFKPKKTGIIKHTYSGKKAPWEFPSMIMCWSDIYRVEAKELLDKAEQIECPESYQDIRTPKPKEPSVLVMNNGVISPA